ncbi:MAG: Na+-transporting NADH:ubiquinone oxidoreductase subunit C [Myxococcota bacterium]|jgi:Na+-transporting NADH:ubiquinone oxidoreductase subunit C
MAFSNGYVFGFATAVCVVCSVAVASVSIGLKDRQDANRRRDVRMNILAALGLPEDGRALLGEEIDQLWDKRVQLRFVDPSGAAIDGAEHDQNGDGVLDQRDADVARAEVKGTDKAPAFSSLYVRMDGPQVGAYALPMYGVGLWGPISGFLALDPGGTEVTGTTFFAPKETPGLGAEITEPKFKSQWVGKKIVDAGETRTIRVVKGEASVLCPGNIDFCVDGVSGATITSRGVDAMVDTALAFYDPYLTRIRGR